MNSILARDRKHLFLERTNNEGNSFVADVNILVNSLDTISLISDHIDNIDTVAEHIDAVDTVANNILIIENVNNHIEDILYSNANLEWIVPVGKNIQSVITNANNIEAIKTCSDDIASIVKVAEEDIPVLARQIQSDRIQVQADRSVVEGLRAKVAADRVVTEENAQKALYEASRATIQANLADSLRRQAGESASQAKASEIVCVDKAKEVSLNTQIVLENTEAARIYSYNANVSKEEAKIYADKVEAERLLTDKNLQDDILIHTDVVEKYNHILSAEEDIDKSEELCKYYKEKAWVSEYHAGNYFRQCEYLAFYSKDYYDKSLEAIENTKQEVTDKVNEIASYRDTVVEKANEVSNNTEIVKELELSNKGYSEEVISNRNEVEGYKNEIKELRNTILQLLDGFNTKVTSLENTIQEYEEEYEARKNSGFVGWLQYELDKANNSLVNLLQTKHFVVLRNNVRRDLEEISLSFNQQMAENDLTDLIQSRRIGIKKRDPIPVSYFDDDSDGDSAIDSPTSIGMDSLILELDDGTFVPMSGVVVTP